MEALKFYRDVEDDFSCNIKVEGASLSSSSARLVLELASGKILLFKGSIDSDGKVNIPLNLKEVSEDSGTATLEIIAESTYFTPYSSRFTLDTKKKITVESVSTRVPEEKKVTVEVVSSNTVKESTNNPKKKSTSILRENAKDYAFISRHLDQYQPKYIPQLQTYKPHRNIVEWAKRNFVTLEDPRVKFCMYIKENRIRKSK